MTIFPYHKAMLNLQECDCIVCRQIKTVLPILDKMPIADYYQYLVILCEWLKFQLDESPCAKIALRLLEQSRINILMELSSDNASRN